MEGPAKISATSASREQAGSIRDLLGRLLHDRLASIGLVAGALPPRDADPMLWKAMGVANEHHHDWVRRSVDYLLEYGYSDPTDGGRREAGRDRSAQAWTEWGHLRSRCCEDERLAAMVGPLDAVLANLPAILAGEMPVGPLLPPGAALDWIVDESDIDADSRCRSAAYGFVADYVEERARVGQGEGLRIVDLGPAERGVDALVQRLLDRHGAHIAEYCHNGLPDDARDLVSADARPALIPYPFYPDRPRAPGSESAGRSDIVIVSQLLHRARDVRGALGRIKAELKENGLLVLDEIGGFDIAAHLSVGLLPRWWSYDDPELRLDGSPAMAPDAWLDLLESAGFRQAFVLAEQVSGLRRHVLLAESDGMSVAALAAEQVAESAPPLERTDEDACHDVAEVVRESLVAVLRLDPSDLRDDVNFERYGIDSLTSGKIINRIAQQFSVALPATLMFDFSSVADLTRHLLEIIPDAARLGAAATPASSSEVAEALGAVEAAQPMPGARGDEAAVADAENKVRKVVIDRPCAIEDLRIVAEDLPMLGPREVRIAVRAFSLNFGDLLCVKGLYPTMPPYPFTPGMEVAGVVSACGAEVAMVRPGDAVVAMTGAAFGGHATFVTCEQHQLWLKPEGLGFEEACSLPIAAITMIEVFRRAHLKRGERILIQTAAGGAGLVAVQLAQHIGAEIFATAGTQEKLDHLARCGVPHGINYLESDFAAEIARRTAGRGVDVVINTLSGDAIQKGLDSLAPGGRYVEIAMTGLKGARSVDLSVLDDNQSFHSLDLRRQLSGAPDRMRELFAELTSWVERGVIRPVVGAIVPFDEVGRAYRLLEERRNIGKVVVQVPAAAGLMEAGARPEAARPIARPAPVATVGTAPDAPEPIAIVGMSGRFPQCSNLDALWAHLAAGTDLTTTVSRWPLPGNDRGKAHEWRGGFLDGIDRFDAGFFNITTLEALYMDPQQRVFLEEAWSALEDAGYAGAAVEEKPCGVWVGAASVDYDEQFQGEIPPQAFWGNAGSVIPARIAYHLNLQGPAVAVDTACSSSLVATHLACQSLWLGEVDMALAGGVFLQPGPSFFVSSISADMISPTGRCHAFDNRADGFVPGEGVGVLVLKRLADAIADRDHIHGLIRGIGMNQDGTTSGLTAPSGRAQARLERTVYDKFGVHPETIQLVEAHGTGTKLGDPIEYRALTEAFDAKTVRRNYCAIGSIKTNLGHTVMAAGVAGVLKVLLALRHRSIPPSLHFESGNADIDFANSPFFVNTSLRAWPSAAGQPRRAAVSSFGFSGTNAHAVIEEGPEVQRCPTSKPGYLIALSARTPEELRKQAERMLDWCGERQPVDAGDVSYTLLLGRRHFDHRLVAVVTDVDDLRDCLQAWLSGESTPRLHVGRVAASAQDRAQMTRRARELAAEARITTSLQGYRELLAAIGALFVGGGEIDFTRFFAGEAYGRIPLPTYPFSRVSYWVGGALGQSRPTGDAAGAEPGKAAAGPSGDDGAAKFQILTRTWAPAPIELSAPEAACQRHWIFLDPGMAALQPRLSALLPDADVDLLLADNEGVGSADRLSGAVIRIVERIARALSGKPRGRLFVQVLGSKPPDGPDWTNAIAALFKCAAVENPKFSGQVISADTIGVSGSAEIWAQRLIENRKAVTESEVRYSGAGERNAVMLEPCPSPVTSGKIPWKEGGVYLITGGGGALGLIFAREIASRCSRVAIVLAGRSPESSDLGLALERLRSPDVLVEYRRADVTSGADVEGLIAAIVKRHGNLDGLIHAAGVTRDDFLIRKDPSQIRDVLAPKALGVEHLDRATSDLPLDFFVTFSSVAAVFGNAGQGDYAAANAFVDRFAEYRSELVARGERQGRTASVAWPLWADGGMGRDPGLRAQLAEFGMSTLETHLGLRAFYDALASGRTLTIVMPTPATAAEVDDEAARSSHPERSGSLPGPARADLDLWGRLVAVLQEVTLLPADRFDPDATFESFGMDSLMIARLHRKLATAFPDLPKTLFFEYPTLREVHDHLIAEYPGECAAWRDPNDAQLSSAPTSAGTYSGGTPTPDTAVPEPGGIDAASLPTERSRSIAIIGMSGIYPDAPDLDRFWNNLAAGRHCLSEVPAERWSLDDEHCDDPGEARRAGKSYCKIGGFLSGFANFDPLFFGIAPTEALSMDPQERLFLQECWHAMEDSGYTRDALRERHGQRVGVFAGVSKTGYELYGPDMWRHGEEVHLRTSFSSVANRVSYVLDLRGPSVALDTMCSSSLTSIHYACESLLRDECELAFAGGVNLYLHPETYATLCAAGMLSPSGACRSFGADADGFIPGEGVGVLLLKRLDRAIADGDNIHAVVRASAINHGGHTHGYTVPNPRAQRELIRSALDKAGVSARDIDYVEAHGTGTALGDPVEIAGLSQAFAPDAPDLQFCSIGSVKSNIGHLEAAAGIAGVSKVVLQMKHGKLAPSLHAEEPNGDIRFERTQFRLQQELAEWPAHEGERKARLASVSSFGAGGANGHLILEEHGETRGLMSTKPEGAAFVVLSARDEERLRVYAERLADWLDRHAPSDRDLPDLAYTLQVGREAMRHRLALEVTSIDDLRSKLRRFALDGDAGPASHHGDTALHKDSLAPILAHTDPAALAEALIEQRDHYRLLDLWTKGLAVDWRRLYPSGTPRRISLPGYPFAEERYWPRAATARSRDRQDGIRLLFPAWHRQPSTSAPIWPAAGDNSALIAANGVLPGDSGLFKHVLTAPLDADVDNLADMLSACGSLDHVLWRAPGSKSEQLDDVLLQDLRDCLQPCFRLVKALLRLGYGDRTFGLTIIASNGVAAVPGELADPAHAALHGFCGALAKEHPSWRVRLVDIDGGEGPPLAELMAIPADPRGECTAIRDGQWFRQTTTLGTAGSFGEPPYRHGGVYVLLGGAGHIGTVFSEQLVRDYQAQVVWIGRRPVDQTIQAAIDRLARFGPAPLYIQADARDRASLERAYHQIVAAFGAVNGIVHSAIVLGDSSVANMDEELFLAAVSAKSDSSLRLAQIFKDEDLDFVLFFSSLESFGKLAGQSNYAAGCLFADAFAHRLRKQWRVPVKIINWGNWNVIDGKSISPAIAASMDRTGVGVLTPGEGLAGVAMLLAGPHDQFGYYKSGGSVAERPLASRLDERRTFAAPDDEASDDERASRPALASEPREDPVRAVRDTLVERLRQAVGLTSQPVLSDEPLAAYGVDSITGAQFIRLVNMALDIDLDIKVIYDYPSIGALTKHIVSRFGASLDELIQARRSSEPVPQSVPPIPTVTPPQPSAGTAAKSVKGADQLIAIVGLSARYPQSRDAHELWQHLVDGDDLVGEASRWDESVIAGGERKSSSRVRGGFLDGVEFFDPLFFGIAKNEARYMDPQQRIFLEEAWHALEDAGYAGPAIRGRRCGVYAGYNGSDYHRLFSGDLPPQALWGNAPSILSARIAYHLDLQGPAITIDTACSSSLVAIHLACQALRHGEIDIALAGGAQVYCTPTFHVAAGKAGMLSATGRCHSFDDRADGFVPAEGAGVLVLKRLSDAIESRDTIYGVVRGSATNQDGATNGITAPSGLSQERLERSVYRDSGISPRDIQLVEAHGTGTRLGDPIEFGALATVFGEHTRDTGFCALGSIKSNVGHTLAAAGVAGAIKVLLALKHEQIPPSIHFETGNRHIGFENSPFYVPRRPVAWPRDPARPRLAAVSSFGFSGTNAHLVLGEAPPDPARPPLAGPHLVVLSARSMDQLRQSAERLRDHVAASAPDCADLSYTLAVGRHHFAHRLAMVVEDIAELHGTLSAWLERDELPGGFVGRLREKDLQDREDEVELVSGHIRAWRDAAETSPIRRGELLRLAELHAQGYPVNFDDLFEDRDVGRIPLPVYPFRRERCWVGPPSSEAAESSDPRPAQVALELDGRDARLQGHMLGAGRAVPGIACLSFVLEAFRDAPGFGLDVDLGDVLWLRPIMLDDGPLSLVVDIRPAGDSAWRFEVRGSAGDSAVYCRGRAVPRGLEGAAPGGLEEARRACGPLLSRDEALRAIDDARVAFPATQDLIDGIAVGRHGVLARLRRLDPPAADAEAGVLHPALLDAALQACAAIGAEASEGEGSATPLLFALGGLRIGHAGPVAWAWARRRDGSARESFTLDIDFFDDDGSLRASLCALTLRQARSRDAATSARGAVPDGVGEGLPAPTMKAFSLVPCWTEAPDREPVETMTTLVFALSERAAAWARKDLPDTRIVILSPTMTVEAIADLLIQEEPVERVICCLSDSGEGSGLCQARAATHIFRIAKALLLSGRARSPIEFVTITERGTAVRPVDVAVAGQAAVHGVVGCLAKEQPSWRVKAADVPSLDSVGLADILRVPASADGDVVAFHEDRWLRRAFAERPLGGAGKGAFRDGGVYVILGGAGALGEILSEHLIRRHQAQIVWIGRRPIDEEIQAKIRKLARIGPSPRYISADARDPAGFRRALDTVSRLHPFIDGLVHSALVLSGSDIEHMSEERFAEVFATKADVCENIAQLCQPGSVGLVLFFSSIQSLQRTERQSNYAAGCAFKDAYAGIVAERLGCPVKTVNWGYWGGVGKAAGLPAFQNWLKQAGMGSIEPDEGMAFLERFLESPFEQVAYVKAQEGARLRGITIIGGSDMPNDDPQRSIMDAIPRAASPASTSRIVSEMSEYPTGEFDQTLGRLLRLQLASLGVFDRECVEPLQARKAAGIIDLYQPWFEESLRFLTRLGCLERDGKAYRCLALAPADHEPWREWESRKLAWSSFPQLAAFVGLVENTLRALPDILTGRVMATEIIFPGSSLRLVEPIYKQNSTADYFNDVLAQSLVCYVRERARQDPDAAIRILEVGAGTGGTTSALIPRLAPYARWIADYRYTDLSKAFLLHAEEKYGPDAPYLSYAIFDAERPPEDQGLAPNHFDVVVAANVLHATRAVRDTLENVQACLKPGGILLLNEMSANSLFTHLTFGLLKGWWLSEDPDLRIQGSPVVPQEGWRRVLADTGFGTILFPTEQVAHLGQQIVVAQKGVDAEGGPRGGDELAQPAGFDDGDIHGEADRRSQLKQLIVTQLSRALEMEAGDIDPDASFADYGLDSIIAIATVDALNDQLGLSLTSTSLFEHSSVNLLIDFILSLEAARPSAEASKRAEARPRALETPATAPAFRPPDQASVVPTPEESVPPPAMLAIEPIAIVGASGRFGSADSLAELWSTLASGGDRIEPISRWDMTRCYDAPEGAADYCWHGSFLKDIDCFDPTFFNISGIEATYMDPQQRLFLEEAWKALEDGGYAGSAIEGRRCGVYVGQNGEDYRGYCTGSVPPQAMWGNAASILSARISYYLNLKGPAITIDTACSSSLVAVHLACQALRLRETDMAIAGGVAARCTPEFYKATATTKMLSTTGHCRPFDAQADGFIPGEGVGAILLKRLSDAVADGDHIYAVIKGSCLNQDGTTNGITAPSAGSQEKLHLEAFELTNTRAEQIQLVEAHGTGTRLGDPIEHEALTRAFRHHTERKGFCALGSIKGTIGHTTAAAGVASIMKVILALQHRKIPPSANFVAPNPLLRMDDSPFYVNTDLREWRRPDDGPRCAAISSFGISGTNAHLLLEEGPPVPAYGPVAPAYLIVLSARSEDQLRALLDSLLRRCEEDPSLDCAAISYTLLAGRKHLSHRIAMVVRDTARLVAAGRQYLDFGQAEDVYVSAPSQQRQEHPSLLTAFGDQCIRECAAGMQGPEYLSRLRTVAELFVQRQQLDLPALFPDGKGRRVPLPTYPFARERYWASDDSPLTPETASWHAEARPTVEEPQPVDVPPPLPVASRDPNGGGASLYHEVLGSISTFFVEEMRLPADKVGVDEDIQTYGMDSLIGMRLLRRLEKDFGVALSNSELLELRTAAKLAKVVAERADPPSLAGDGGQAVVSLEEAEAERRAAEVLARFDRGEIDITETELMLTEIALA